MSAVSSRHGAVVEVLLSTPGLLGQSPATSSSPSKLAVTYARPRSWVIRVYTIAGSVRMGISISADIVEAAGLLFWGPRSDEGWLMLYRTDHHALRSLETGGGTKKGVG